MPAVRECSIWSQHVVHTAVRRLLDVARRRFAARGWRNVQVLCQDATFFSLPEWGDNLDTARGAVRSVPPTLSLQAFDVMLNSTVSFISGFLKPVYVELFPFDDTLLFCAAGPDRRAVSIWSPD